MFRRRMTRADAAAFKFLLQNYQIMYYTLDKLPDMGQPFGQVFMAEDGKLFRNWKGSDCPKEGNWLVHVNLCETAATVLAVSNGRVVNLPKWQPNAVFSDGNGNDYVIAATENKNQIVSRAGIAGGGFLFLPRPMINITDEDNVYAIRHEVFSGNEVILGSHKIIKRFLPKAPLSVNEMREISAACKKEQDVSNVFVVLNWQVRFEEVPASIYQFIE